MGIAYEQAKPDHEVFDLIHEILEQHHPDLAVEQGGNCPLSEPGKVVQKHGVTLVGYTNMPGRIAVDASALYARNLLNFLGLLITKEKQIAINLEDEIIKGTLLTKDGQMVHQMLKAA